MAPATSVAAVAEDGDYRREAEEGEAEADHAPGDSAEGEGAQTPPKSLARESVRSPATRSPSGSERCFQPRSIPMMRPMARATASRCMSW